MYQKRLKGFGSKKVGRPLNKERMLLCRVPESLYNYVSAYAKKKNITVACAFREIWGQSSKYFTNKSLF